MPKIRDNRLNPQSGEEALAYQLEDSVRVLKASARLGPEAFENALDRMESHINVYRAVRAVHSTPATSQKSALRKGQSA